MFLKESNYSFWFVLRLFRKDILRITAITIAVSYADNLMPNDTALPIAVPALLGTALSLILAFRTGQAYDRWWEARKIWGEIINDSRSLLRIGQSFVADAEAPEGKSFLYRLAMRQIAWCYALGSSLRKQDAFIHAADFLSKEERAQLSNFKNVPNALLIGHSQSICEAHKKGMLSALGQYRMDELVTRLTDCMGKCERIKNTVFPTPYTLIVHFIIYIFTMSLTLAIEDGTGIIEIPLSIILSMVFFALERIAIILQDPFENNPSDIPVTAIARNIEIDLKQMVGDSHIPNPIQPVRNYLL